MMSTPGVDYSQLEERMLAFLDPHLWRCIAEREFTAAGRTPTEPTKENLTMNKAEQLKARLKREDELRPIIEAYIAGKPVWWRNTSRTKRWEQSQIDDGIGGLGFLSSFASIQYRLTPPPPEKLTVTLELTPGEALTLLNQINVSVSSAEKYLESTRDTIGNKAIIPANCHSALWANKDSLAEQLLAFLQAQD